MEAAAEVVVGGVGVVDDLDEDLADGDVGGDGEGGTARVLNVLGDYDAVVGLDVARGLDLDGYCSGQRISGGKKGLIKVRTRWMGWPR